MKRLVILSLVLLLTLAAAIPVFADKPVVETGTLDDIPWELEYQPCPDLVLMDHEVGIYSVTWHYDREGNLVFLQNDWSGVDHLYNADNPDVVLTGHFSAHYRYNALTGEESITGIMWNITVPGYGTVVVDAGRWVPVTGKYVGKRSWDDPEDMAQLCSLLGG